MHLKVNGFIPSGQKTLRRYPTERFIMFSVITNMYSNKTKGPVHSHRKTEKVILTARAVRCVHHG
jgi:hypothetical protein